VLRLVLRFGVVLALAFAAAVAGAMVAWSAGTAAGVRVGTAMLPRLLVLLLVAGVLARAVDAEAILRLARRLRLERVGLVLGLALNTLPHLGVVVRDVWIAYRIRHRDRRGLRALRALPAFLEVLLAHTARIADEAAAAAALRGHSALVREQRLVSAPTRLVLVTGASGSGKTAAVTRALEQLCRQGVAAAGFVQPGVWEDGSKVGFEVEDVATNERAPLARRVGRDQGQHGTGFRFERPGFDLAARALARVAPGMLLVVDELGPLELRGRGHMSAVRAVLAMPGLAGAVVVVRRHLVPSLLAALEAEDAVVVDVEEDGDAAEAIVAALDPPARPS